jgi:YD repeat-containing protein
MILDRYGWIVRMTTRGSRLADRRPWRGLLALLVASTSSASVASAQTVFDQNGFGAGRGTYSALPYEHVDPLSGNLILVTTDLSLPGNNGLDLNVQRVYNSAVYPHYANLGDTTLDEDSWAGIGWRLHFGRVLHETDNTSGATTIEMGDGSGHALYTTPLRSEGWITTDFWVYNKLTHELKLPNGLVYTFGRNVFLNPTVGFVRYVTEIRDPFNNTITFDYFLAGGPPDGVREIRQDLGGGQVRTVTFDYDATYQALRTMTFDGRVWTYDHAALGGGTKSALVSVTPPVGGKWVYTYESAPGFVGLTSMQAPQGGAVSYTYADTTRVAGPFTQLSRVVATRSVGGPTSAQITPGTWTFTYNAGTNKDETIVNCPCGTTVYRYFGIGLSGSFEAWRSGLLAERRVLGPYGQNLEQEELTWVASAVVSPDAVPGQSGVWSDPAVYNALLSRRVLRRDTQAWTTDFAYHPTDYNDYAQPYQMTQTDGTRTRVTTRTFLYNFTAPLYMGPRVQSTQMTLGTETRTSSVAYELSTGFVLSTTTGGIPTYFGRLANGNLRSITDAHGHQTLLSYSWGVVSETQTPLLTTTRQITNAGLVSREQVGTLFTDYTYDAAFRPYQVKPPNTAITTYEYDTLYDGWYRVARGSAQTQYNLDGFGRPVSTSNQVGLKTKTVRNACGQVTFQTLPYTNATYDNRGTTTTHDPLGRVTKTRFFNGDTTGTPEYAETVYDYTGLNVTITDPLSHVTQQRYAAIGGPGDAVLASVVDAANQTTTYSYNIANQLTGVGGAMAPRTWVYNAQGQLMSETQPESGATGYTYDTAGMLKTVTDATGQVFTLTYDANERLTVRDGPGTASDVSFFYDATYGRLWKQTTADVTTTYQFEAATGRLSGRTDVFGGTTYQSTYGYDSVDSLTTLTYPSGRAIGYTYDAESRLTGITQNGAPFATTFLYDDGGGLVSYVTGATTHRVEYDRWQRVKRMTSGATATPSLDLTYAYNLGSQVTGITDTRPGYSWAFGYDVLNRLTSAWGPYTGMSWGYDGRGNRTSETQFDAATTYTYDPATQRLTSTSGAVAETFTYDALGRLKADSRGSYGYTPSGMLATVTAPSVAASYTYDAEALRILHTVNNVSTYSIRSAGSQVLTEYASPCGGAPTWARDVIYAGSRVVGAIKASTAQPTVAMAAATSSVSEAAGTAPIAVRVTTPTGAALACPVTVSYATAATGATGVDFLIAQGTLTFPAGTASGATQTFAITLINDSTDEPNEIVSAQLTGATGGALGAVQHTVTIVDDDPPPAVTINDVSVTEGPGVNATFTVSLSSASTYPVTVTYATAPETAKVGLDYQAVSGTLTFTSGQLSKPVSVLILDDGKAEPSETFLLQLSAPVNATIARAAGRGTIGDNERARVLIDPSLPGLYVADATSAAGFSDWIVVYNPHAVGLNARVTYTRPDASGWVQDLWVPAKNRIIVNPYYQSGVAGEGEVSMAVQSTNPAYSFIVDHSQYWGSSAESGRSTRATEPAPHWYFADGATSPYFDEYLTFYNPTNAPIRVDATLLPSSGSPLYYAWELNEAPGRLKIRLNDYVNGLEHGTVISATRQTDGAPVPIVVERGSFWANGDRREGNSSSGSAVTSTAWGFAEAAKGGYATYLALMNPTATTANTGVYWVYDNSVFYGQAVTVPPMSRVTVSPPASLPSGGLGINIESPGVGIVAERSIYSGPNWEIGDSDIGASDRALHWKFADGASSSFFSTYVLLMNPFGTPAAVTLTYHKEDGTTVTQTVTVPNSSRISLDMNSVPGLANSGYAIDVDVTNGIPIVAERVMYFPGVWGGAHVSLGRPQ